MGQFRMPTAREMIRPIVTNEIRACALISAFCLAERRAPCRPRVNVVAVVIISPK